MAQLAIPGLTAAVGFMVGGPTGAQIGWMLGAYIGGKMARNKGESGQDLPDIEGPRLTDLAASTSAYGQPIVRGFGTFPVSGHLIWSTDLIEHVSVEEVENETGGGDTGKGGGGGGGGSVSSQSYTTYTYSVSAAWALCEGPMSSVRRIWFDSELVYDVRETNTGVINKEGVHIRVYLGDEQQMPDPKIEAEEGIDSSPAYRGICYIVVDDLFLELYGNRRPNVRAEVVADVDVIHPFSQVTPITTNTISLDKETNQLMVAGGYNGTTEIWDPYLNELLTTFTNTGFSPGCLYNGYTYGGFLIDFGADLFEFRKQNIWSGQVSSIFTWTGGGGTSFVEVEGVIVFHEAQITQGIFLCSPYTNQYTLFQPLVTGFIGLAITYEPDTGLIWMVSTKGADVNDELHLMEKLSDPIYSVLEGPSSWGFDIESVKLSTIFGKPTHVCDRGMEYDPATQSLILSTNDGGDPVTYVPTGIYRIAFTIRHDLSTAYIAASNLTPSLAVQNIHAHQGVAADGSGFVYWSHGNGHEIYEFWTDDLSINRTFDYFDNDPPLGQLMRQMGIFDPRSKVFYSELIALGTWRFQWDRSPTAGERLDVVVRKICNRHGLSDAEIDVSDLASKIVPGYVLSRPSKAKDQISQLMTGYFFDVVETDKKIFFILRDNSSIVTIDESELAAHEPDQTMPTDVILNRREEYQIPNMVQLTHISPPLEYESGIQYTRKATIDTKNILKLELPICYSDDEAMQVTAVWMQLLRTERHTFEINLGPKYFYLNPADIIKIDRGNFVFTARIQRIDVGGPGIIQIEAVSYEAAAYVSNAIGSSIAYFRETEISYPPITLFHLLNMPAVRSYDDDAGYYAAFGPSLASSPWPGGTLYRQDNFTSPWLTVKSYKAEASMGYATGALPSGNNTVWDWDNSLNIVLRNSKLVTSDTRLNVLNGANVLFFPSTGELIQFRDVFQEVDDSFTLTGLLRGRKGTEWAIDGHFTSEPVVIINVANTYKIYDELTNVGKTYNYAAATSGKTIAQSLNTTWANEASAIKPYSPCNLNSIREQNGDLTLTWLRRARINQELTDSVDVALDEPTEEYDVELYSHGILVRTERVISTTEIVYTAAMQITDTGDGLVGAFSFCVYQISSRVGRGYSRCNPVLLEDISTNWEEYTVSESPVDWYLSAPFSGETALVISDTTGEGESKVLELTTTDTTYTNIIWGRASPSANVDILVKVHITHALTWGVFAYPTAGCAARIQEVPSANYYMAGIRSDNGHPAIWKVVAGWGTILQQHNDITITTDSWCWVRFRLSGDLLQAKFWVTSEPDAWDIELVDTTHSGEGLHAVVGPTVSQMDTSYCANASFAYQNRTASPA